MVRRALTRQTRWYQIRCSTFKINDFIVERPFWKILEFWPLVTSILTWAKKWPKWFRNDFSRAFERCLSFFSTATRSRDHGGRAFKRPPPPPSRRWKIQRPSRARANPITGGGGGRIAPPPPARFSALYGKRLKMGTWNFVTFPKHSLGILYKIFEFLLCAEAPPGPLSRGHYQTFTPCSPTWNRLWFSETVKIRMCAMDLVIEKLVLKLGRNRSRNNEVITFLNIWCKNDDWNFWPPEPQICEFWGFSKTDLVVHD